MKKEIFINESMGETRIAIQEDGQIVEVYIERQDKQRMVGNIYKGKVQNVGFRHWFSDLAISLGLDGYVQNKQSKDEVEAIVQGDMQSILSITEKSKIGPELAFVEGVIPSSIISNVKYSGFIVKYENN